MFIFDSMWRRDDGAVFMLKINQDLNQFQVRYISSGFGFGGGSKMAWIMLEGLLAFSQKIGNKCFLKEIA